MTKVVYDVATSWSTEVSCIYMRLMTLVEGTCTQLEDCTYVTIEASDGTQYFVNAFNLIEV